MNTARGQHVAPVANALAIALVTLGDPNRLTGGYLFHQRMAERAAAHGARVRFVSIPLRPLPLAIFGARRALSEVSGADVLVLDSIAAEFVAPWLAFRAPRVPIVAMLHQPPGGIETGALRTIVQSRLDWHAYRQASRLMVASEALAEEMLAAGAPPAAVRVVLPGCDGAGPCAQTAGDLCQGRPVAFLCVANWLPHKGILDLLEAFARLPSDAATLHLVGDSTVDPSYAERVQAMMVRPDLASRVVVHGCLAPESVPALYAGADVFVLPSLKETYGTVYAEAMAAGLPVVGYRAGNLPHLAQDGREGLLAAPGDIAGLSRALSMLAENAVLRRRLAMAAQARARSFPTWDDSAEVFFAVIREAVEETRRLQPS